MRGLGLLAFASALAIAGCATQSQNVEMQRPALPNTQGLAWQPSDRLYRSVTVDFVKGMSRRSYLFSEGNQLGYKPMLETALKRADLLAPTAVAARYALQVDFSALDGAAVGTDFTASSQAIYRLVDRSTGKVVFEKPISAEFTAEYPGLNESDAEKAVNGSVLAVGAVVGTAVGDSIVQGFDDGHQISDKEARQYYQAAAWALLFGPAYAGISFINPFNYVAFGNYAGATPTPPLAREGSLATQGIGSRSGSKRGSQADYQIMAQSITKFVIGLGDTEHVEFTTLLPCLNNVEVNALKHDLMAKGMRWRTDDCVAYSRAGDPSGLGYTTYK